MLKNEMSVTFFLYQLDKQVGICISSNSSFSNSGYQYQQKKSMYE